MAPGGRRGTEGLHSPGAAAPPLPPPPSPRSAAGRLGDVGPVCPPLPPGSTAGPGAERHRAHAPRAPGMSPARSLSTVTSASCGAGQPSGLPANHPPVHNGVPQRPPRKDGSARTQTRAVWRPHAPWTERHQRSPHWCLYEGGRGTDRDRATPRPPLPETPRPTRTQSRPQGGRQPDPPPPPHTSQAPDHSGRTGLPMRRQPRARQGGAGTGRPPPTKLGGARDRGRKRGGAQTAWNGPNSARLLDRA